MPWTEDQTRSSTVRSVHKGRLMQMRFAHYHTRCTRILQANGLDERMNQTLKFQLQKLVKDDWDQLINNVLFAYRSSRHDSIRCTPFLLMYGRDARLPIDLSRVLQQETMDEPDLKTKIAKVNELQKKLDDQARENITLRGHSSVRRGSSMQSTIP